MHQMNLSCHRQSKILKHCQKLTCTVVPIFWINELYNECGADMLTIIYIGQKYMRLPCDNVTQPKLPCFRFQILFATSLLFGRKSCFDFGMVKSRFSTSEICRANLISLISLISSLLELFRFLTNSFQF